MSIPGTSYDPQPFKSSVPFRPRTSPSKITWLKPDNDNDNDNCSEQMNMIVRNAPWISAGEVCSARTIPHNSRIIDKVELSRSSPSESECSPGIDIRKVSSYSLTQKQTAFVSGQTIPSIPPPLHDKRYPKHPSTPTQARVIQSSDSSRNSDATSSEQSEIILDRLLELIEREEKRLESKITNAESKKARKVHSEVDNVVTDDRLGIGEPRNKSKLRKWERKVIKQKEKAQAKQEKSGSQKPTGFKSKLKLSRLSTSISTSILPSKTPRLTGATQPSVNKSKNSSSITDGNLSSSHPSTSNDGFSPLPSGTRDRTPAAPGSLSSTPSQQRAHPSSAATTSPTANEDSTPHPYHDHSWTEDGSSGYEAGGETSEGSSSRPASQNSLPRGEDDQVLTTAINIKTPSLLDNHETYSSNGILQTQGIPMSAVTSTKTSTRRILEPLGALTNAQSTGSTGHRPASLYFLPVSSTVDTANNGEIDLLFLDDAEDPYDSHLVIGSEIPSLHTDSPESGAVAFPDELQTRMDSLVIGPSGDLLDTFSAWLADELEDEPETRSMHGVETFGESATKAKDIKTQSSYPYQIPSDVMVNHSARKCTSPLHLKTSPSSISTSGRSFDSDSSSTASTSQYDTASCSSLDAFSST